MTTPESLSISLLDSWCTDCGDVDSVPLAKILADQQAQGHHVERLMAALEDRERELARAKDRIIVLEQAINGPHGWKAEHASDLAALSAQRKRIAELTDDSDALIALWLYPPDDVAFWKVAYPDLDAFRRAIDSYTKKKQDEKWGYPS